jgi:hypothetical protein
MIVNFSVLSEGLRAPAALRARGLYGLLSTGQLPEKLGSPQPKPRESFELCCESFHIRETDFVSQLLARRDGQVIVRHSSSETHRVRRYCDNVG